jgi:hypothetical protein
MTTAINTFASAEKQLLSNGFICTTLDRYISVFKSETQIAYVYFLGLGNGFKTTIYDIIAEA